jgi:hypothetical protein
MEQEIAELERRADDDVAVVDLPRDQAPSVSPFEEAVAAALGDTVELSSQAADVGERQAADSAAALRWPSQATSDASRSFCIPGASASTGSPANDSVVVTCTPFGVSLKSHS